MHVGGSPTELASVEGVCGNQTEPVARSRLHGRATKSCKKPGLSPGRLSAKLENTSVSTTQEYLTMATGTSPPPFEGQIDPSGFFQQLQQHGICLLNRPEVE